MSYPPHLGQPCWTLKQVSKVIPPAATAQTSDESIPYFLASHSPFSRITDIRAPARRLKEEDVFQEIFSRGRGQVEAFVTGEPGTGKSHLIRWLRLRAGYAAKQREAELDQFKLILVSRGTGSLKDALGQVVQQLGRDFRQHLRRVQTAIERISDATARATLLSELALEVDSRWVNERRREPLPRELKQMGQALRADGFGGWFKRDGGVIHQVIQRLTEHSSVEDRENFPSFQASDFDVALNHLRAHDNSPEVLNFAEDLKEEPETRAKAAEVLNIALQDAVRGLTGLKGSDLLEVFTDIRRELGPSRSLAVFIEDVSATSGGLDQDVINAFEPRGGDGLCRMVAVLGIVDSGWDKLQKNQKDRGTHVYQVGGLTASSWAEDTQEVAHFTARYLNAVRSTDAEIAAGAQDFFSNVGWASKCDGCPQKTACHETFGKVTLPHGAEIGTFPYTVKAPQQLLLHLAETRYRSQRGLLTRVLLPVLDQSFNALVTKEFPRPALFGVHSPAFHIWTGFTNSYASGAQWDDEKRMRLRFLAQFWVPTGSAEELASHLEPLRDALGFPKFSRKVGPSPRPPSTSPTVLPPPQPEDAALNHLLNLLESWHDGQPLREDNKFRDLLGEFFARSIAWQDYRGTPISEKKRLVKGNTFPRVEGQVMRPGGTYFFDLERSSATYALLQSLLLFSRSPSRTWAFPHGELHKRELSRWLRKNAAKVVASIQPDPPTLAQDVLRSAVEALALATMLRDRRKLPDGRAERICSLLAPIWETSSRPVVVSSELQSVADDLEQKHAGLRDLVVQELGCGQGDASPKDFLDPVPLLTSLDKFAAEFQFHSAPSACDQNYWKPRFLGASTLAKEGFAALPKRIEKEREAIGKLAQAAAAFVKNTGIDDRDRRDDLEKCLEKLIEVINLQRGTQHKKPILSLPNEPFDQLWQRKLVQTSDTRAAWANAIARAVELAKEKNLASLLAYNPVRLQEAIDALSVIEVHLDLIHEHLSDEENQGGADGDSRPKLLAALREIEQLADTKESQTR